MSSTQHDFPHPGLKLPLTWLCHALALVTALLMLYVPYLFLTPAYAEIYPYLRILGGILLLSSVLMALGAVGLGNARLLLTVGKLLFVVAVGVMAFQSAVPLGLSTRLLTYSFTLSVVLLSVAWPHREVQMAHFVCTALPFGLGVLLLLHPSLVAGHDSPWVIQAVGVLFLGVGLARAAAAPLAQRWPWAEWVSTALVSIPVFMLGLLWLREGDWSAFAVNTTLTLAALLSAAYMRSPWTVPLRGLRRRIMSWALGLTLIPTVLLGALSVYAMERADEARAFDALERTLLHFERLLGRPATPEPVTSMRGYHSAATVIALDEAPTGCGGSGITTFVERGPRKHRLVACLLRPDTGVALVAVQDPQALYRDTAPLAVMLLCLTIGLGTVGAIMGVAFSNGLARRIAEVRDAAEAVTLAHFAVPAAVFARDDDEIAALKRTLIEMMNVLERYLRTLQAQNVWLQAQSEEISFQNENLQAQADEIAAKNAALQTQTALLDLLLSEAPMGFAFLDTKLRYVRVNAALAEVHRIPVEEHIGRSLWEVNPRFADRAESMLRHTTTMKEPVSTYHTGAPGPHGEPRHWLQSCYPVRTTDGEFIGIGTIVLDVTERVKIEETLRRTNDNLEQRVKERTAEYLDAIEALRTEIQERLQAEAALRRSEALFRSLVEGARDYAIYMANPEGIVVFWNSGAERTTGFTADDVIGTHVSRFYEAPEADRAAQELRQAATHGSAEVEGRRIRKDGSRFFANVITTPLRAEDGRLQGFVRVVRDMTERRQADEALRQREAAEERDRTRMQFLQIAAHELRNPMAAVKGMLSLLKRRMLQGKPVQEQLQFVEVGEQEVTRLSDLLNEMLEAFRIQQGRLTLKQERCNLREIIGAALRPFQVAADTHRFALKGTEGEPIWVTGDFGRLEEVFRNLISNAVKYSPGGGDVRITVTQQTEQVLAAVSDQGMGIPPDQVDRVFEGFFRATNLTGVDPGGMGLGLYICRQLVESHGGRIWAESCLERGSTFYVSLPLA